MSDDVDPVDEFEQLQQDYLIAQTQGAGSDVLDRIEKGYLELLKDIRSDELQEELEWAAILIENGEIAPNVFNTFEWVNTCVEQLKDPIETPTHLSSVYPSQEDWKTPDFASEAYIFDDDWRGIETLNSFGKYRSERISEDSDFEYKENGAYFNPVEYLLSNIRCGGIPNPELLLSLAKAFDLYFSRKGELSLEEVFFGAPTKIGNYAKRRNENFKGIDFKQFEDSVRRTKQFDRLGRRNHDSYTIEKLAERFIEVTIHEEPERNLEPEDVDTFLRKYRRWKKRNGIIKKNPHD